MSSSPIAVAYSPLYHFELDGVVGNGRLGNVTEFDARRAERARARVLATLPEAAIEWLEPEEIRRDELERVHATEYLDGLEDPGRRGALVAELLEIPEAAHAPAEKLEAAVLRPMRVAAGGTLAAIRWVLAPDAGVSPVAINLSGGYHHARHASGMGFCAYHDLAAGAAMACAELGIRRVLSIDLDAHQGNGTARLFGKRPDWFHLDVFNADIWPGGAEAEVALAHTDLAVPLRSGCTGADYLAALRPALESALAWEPELVLYNAGSDVLTGDPLGALELSLAEVRIRDAWVLDAARGLPLVATASGGYTQASHRALAGLVELAAERAARR